LPSSVLAGECVGVTISWDLSKTANAGATTSASISIYNGATVVLSCAVVNKLSINCSGTFTSFIQCSTECYCIFMKTNVTDETIDGSCVTSCISALTQCVGTYSIGTPNVGSVCVGVGVGA
jgi:hypothetical protein